MEQPQGRESIGNSQKPTNPSLFFAQWDSTNKCFSYYDKAAKQTILLPLPFAFIPLYKMFTVKGFNQKENKGYWANEVNNKLTEKITVMCKNNATGEIKQYIKGLYSDIKDQIDNRAFFTESLYVGVKDSAGQLRLANIQIQRSGIGNWFDFNKNNDMSKIAVQVASFTNEVSGAVKFTSPVYSALPITPQTDAEAYKLQQIVKEYIAEYLKYTASESNEQEHETQFKSPEPQAQAWEQPAVQAAHQQPSFGAPQVNTNPQGFQTNVSIPPPQQQAPSFGGEIINGNPFEAGNTPPF